VTDNQNLRVHFCPKTWKIPTKTKKYFSQEPFLSMKCSVKNKIETSPGHKAKPAATASTKFCWKKLPQPSPTRCSLTLCPGLLSSAEKSHRAARGAQALLTSCQLVPLRGISTSSLSSGLEKVIATANAVPVQSVQAVPCLGGQSEQADVPGK